MARYSAEIEKIALLLYDLWDKLDENELKSGENHLKLVQKRPKKP